MNRRVFRELVSVETARELIRLHFKNEPVGSEEVPLEKALGRVLSEDVEAKLDVPPFDRASMDGYAVRAEDTFGADEYRPIRLRVIGKVAAGDVPQVVVEEGEAVEISTGAPMPRGANAVVMVEYTRTNGEVEVFHAVAPGENVMAAGSDIMAGELVLRVGEVLTPRETGVLAAIGNDPVKVYRKPKVAIISTGNEIVLSRGPLPYGKIFDINGRTLFDSVVENGGEPRFYGVVGDNCAEIVAKVEEALRWADIVITSGGTSAGVGDLLYRAIEILEPAGVLVHGIAVKPGKPVIIGKVQGKPVFGLPGYPTSAMMIFNVFVRPLLRRMAGLTDDQDRKVVTAFVAERTFSSGGRREFVPVNLVKTLEGSLSVYPVPGESGAITTFSEADGFIEVPEGRTFLEAGEKVEVELLGIGIKPADLMIIGSNCVGIDVILSIMRNQGSPYRAKVISTGSSGGLVAIRRGEADIAGTHLLDEETGVYNIPFLNRFEIEDKAVLVRGYLREQGFLVSRGNPKLIRGVDDLVRSDISIINRNPGSGTRVLLDMKLRSLAKSMDIPVEELTRKIRGYRSEAKSHSAVAVCILQGKADVGLAIRPVAVRYGLEFIPIAQESYDFLIRRERYDKPSVEAFLNVLRSKEFKYELPKRALGLTTCENTGEVIYPLG
ncbi:MAG: molybdopterin biosynthesis protein [Candidatus Bathyarchaeia archaeon]